MGDAVGCGCPAYGVLSCGTHPGQMERKGYGINKPAPHVITHRPGERLTLMFCQRREINKETGSIPAWLKDEESAVLPPKP